MTVPVIMPDPLSFIPPFSFDIVSAETHEAQAEPTEYPVELGADITDHIKVKPVQYTIVGVVTEYPSGIPTPQVLDVPIFTPSPLSSEAALIGAIGAGIANAILGPPPPIVVTVETQPIPSDPIGAMHDTLLGIKDGKFLCSVTSTTQAYTDMALISVALTRKDDEGKGEFTCIFKNIITVSSETVAAPAPLIKAGLPKVATGAQTPTTTTPAQKATLLLQLGQFAVPSFGAP